MGVAGDDEILGSPTLISYRIHTANRKTVTSDYTSAPVCVTAQGRRDPHVVRQRYDGEHLAT